MRHYDHPAVNARDYAGALKWSYVNAKDPERRRFYWLLERADEEDLNAAIKANVFRHMDQEYQDAVTNAKQNPTLTESRQLRASVAEVMQARRMFCQVTGFARGGPADMIAEYLSLNDDDLRQLQMRIRREQYFKRLEGIKSTSEDWL